MNTVPPAPTDVRTAMAQRGRSADDDPGTRYAALALATARGVPSTVPRHAHPAGWFGADSSRHATPEALAIAVEALAHIVPTSAPPDRGHPVIVHKEER